MFIGSKERFILRSLVEYSGVPEIRFMSRGKSVELVKTRWMLIMYLFDNEKMGYHQIARSLRMDHSSVIHGVRKVKGDESLLKNYLEFKNYVNEKYELSKVV